MWHPSSEGRFLTGRAGGAAGGSWELLSIGALVERRNALLSDLLLHSSAGERSVS